MSYRIRFTPRRPGSIWSAINTRRVAELTASGRMHASGLAAFARRDEERSSVYSFERENPAALEPAQERRFRADQQAWAWFQARPPWYRRTSLHWVTSAKQPATRERRLDALIRCCAAGEDIAPLRRPAK